MKIKDSGERFEFDTGAVRDNHGGKGRMDLLPMRALFEVAKVFEEGAKKYEERNWEKGIPLSRYMDSGLRHAMKHLRGDRDEPHLAQACWNFLCLLDTQLRITDGELPGELNDMPCGELDCSNDPELEPPDIASQPCRQDCNHCILERSSCQVWDGYDPKPGPPTQDEASEALAAKFFPDCRACKMQPVVCKACHTAMGGGS